MKYILALFLCSTANAESTSQHCDDVHSVYSEIAATANNVRLFMRPGACAVSWTSRPGVKVSFTDRKAQREAEIAERTSLEKELEAIEAKTDADITLADLKRAFRVNARLRKLRR